MRRELPGGFELDDDPTRIDLEAVHAYISGESYWGKGRTREFVRSAVEGSQRVMGLYHEGKQVGFARAVSDGTTMAYLADVYVLSPYRGQGLGAQLVRELIDGGGLAKTHWLLHTADAADFYAQLGFVKGPARYPLMERPRGYDSSP